MLRFVSVPAFVALVFSPTFLWGEDAARLAEIEHELSDLPRLIPSLQTCRRIGFHGLFADPGWITIDFGKSVTPDKIALFPARLPTQTNTEAPISDGFPGALEIEIAATPEFDNAVRIARWKELLPGAGESLPFLSFSSNGAAGRYLRIRIPAEGFRQTTDSENSTSKYIRLGEIVVLAGGRNVALRCPVTSSPSIEQPRRWEPFNLTDGYFWCLPLRGRKGSPADGYRGADFYFSGSHPDSKVWVEVDLGESQSIDEIHLTPANPGALSDQDGYGFPRQFKVVADHGSAEEKVILDEVDFPNSGGAESLPNPGAAQICLAPPNLIARRVRMIGVDLWGVGTSGATDQNFLALAELQIWQGNRNLALGKKVNFADQANLEGWSPEALVDGHSSRYEMLDWSTWLEQIERAEALKTEAASIRTRLQERRESNRRTLLFAGIGSAILVALLSIIALLMVRARAAASREALRQRIARDLHDEIGASLSHLAMQSELAGDQIKKGKIETDRLEHISETARSTLVHMRDVIWLLAPTEVDYGELSDRLQNVAHRILDGVNSEIEVTGTRPNGRPSINWSRELVAFYKESLTNAMRHSQANKIKVEIAWDNDQLKLAIIDDGCGFDTNSPTKSSGHGLANLKRRASTLKGNYTIDSIPDRGTTIHLTVPIEQQ